MFFQTLDAIDGKQARRTKTSSPLGELFDHGCDSISTIFVATSVALTIHALPTEPFYFAGALSEPNLNIDSDFKCYISSVFVRF